MICLFSCKTDPGIDLNSFCSSSTYFRFSPYQKDYVCTINITGAGCPKTIVKTKSDPTREGKECNIDNIEIQFSIPGKCHVEISFEKSETYSTDVEIIKTKDESGGNMLCAIPDDIIINIK